MSQIHSDSDALRSFAAEVSSFASAVDQELSRLRAAMGRLGDTWEDEGYKEFSEEFTRTQQRVKQLSEEVRVMRLELTERANAVDDYSRSPVR